MKKTLLLVIPMLLILLSTSCKNEEIDSFDYSGSVENSSSNANAKEADDEETSNTANNYEWEDFLKEYELWVDSYIEITKKYNSNPTDMSIMSEYFDMLTELSEWSTKTEEMYDSLSSASASEIAQYSAELARIANKLSEAY